MPKDKQATLTNPEIAIEEIDRVIASGARFGCVLADAGYGSSGPFRQALSERGLLWAVGFDHFEGRSWAGLHRHALMTMIAYAFLQFRRIKQRDGKKEPRDRHHNRPCRLSGKQSSTSSHHLYPDDVPTVTRSLLTSRNLNRQSSARIQLGLANCVAWLFLPRGHKFRKRSKHLL